VEAHPHRQQLPGKDQTDAAGTQAEGISDASNVACDDLQRVGFIAALPATIRDGFPMSEASAGTNPLLACYKRPAGADE